LEEIELWKPIWSKRQLVSIYFGGGTPSLFGQKRLAAILDAIQPSKDIEITIEANPENITDQLMHEFFAIGINRVSIGVQSFHDGELVQLGRVHGASKAEKAISTTRDAGFENISIDLMYELPNQTSKSWQKTLDVVERLPITHLSLYNLTIEPYTAFHRKEKELKAMMPDEETGAQMYADAISTLENFGLKQYEISAFCKNDLYSRHNIGYWIGREFLGLGPSAFSFFDGKRFQNVAHLIHYCDAIKEKRSPITFTDDVEPLSRKRELLALNLRLNQGVDLVLFEPLEEETQQSIKRLISQELLSQENSRLLLTSRGRFFYDYIASEII
ncbi:MAG TPA: radical SAM family heme chaperone HemW, partial [Chlamydiales bacterium]|nr:radical SAM family heme chaperone HemW [Chlamydiales bacterium]